MEGTPKRGLLRHMLANGALVYPSQGGSCAEGCIALGERLQCRKRSPCGTRSHPIVCRPSVHVGSMDDDQMFSPFSWKGSLLGTPTDINELTDK